jgi:Photosynthetic reaction centre cytochrome C subunit
MKTTVVLITILTAVILFSSFSKSPSVYNNKGVSDSLQKDREKYVAEIKEMIKGKEKIVVDSVFKNLKNIGGFDAEILPVVMEKWSQALGVSCSHCHETGNWETDTKAEKDIARKMADLSTMINTQLRKIEGIKSSKPLVNCATCHRGQLKPAISVILQ